MAWEWNNDPQNPEADPVLDSWGWDSYWSCDDWRNYMLALITAYGIDQARNVFRTQWEKQDFWAKPRSFCKYDAAFYDFIKANFPDEQANVIAGTVHAAGNVGEALDSATDALKHVIPIAVILLLVFASIFIYRNIATA